MRAIGYSTGALASEGLERALDVLLRADADAIELSALRMNELAQVIAALEELPPNRFRHVSLHAPTKFADRDEPQLIATLKRVADKGRWIIAHPDSFHNVDAWNAIGDRLCLENMDKRKPIGRTADELATFFERLPKAGLCFDVAHARQVDGSMTEAYLILRRFADRLRQIHMSEVGAGSSHSRMSSGAIRDLQDVLSLIPIDTPVINEAPVSPGEINRELDAARMALTPSLT